MSVYFGFQLLLAAAAVWIVAERVRTLLYRAPIETRPWLRAVSGAVADGDREAAEKLVEAARPAWVAEVAARALRGNEPETSDAPEAQADLDELLTDYKYEAFRWLRELRVLATAGTASGFFGAILEMIWLLRGEHGLAGLQAGRVQRMAMEDAVMAVAMGIAISIFGFMSLAILKKAAAQLLVDVGRTATELE